MGMTSDDPNNLHTVTSEISSREPFSARDLTSPNTEVDESPGGYRSFVKTPALERSVEEARKQYLILKQKAKDKLDSIRMPRPSDDNKAMSPVHTPLEHSTLMPNTGSYRPQSGKVLEPNKGLIVLDTDDSDLDTERMTILDAKNKMRNAAKSRGHTGKGGQFDQAQKIKDHQHGTNVPVTRAETFHKGNVQYVSAFSGMETENRQFEKEKTMQEIVKLVEETQYYKDRQIMFDDEKEINKLKKEKLRIEIAILEKRLLGRIKQIQY
ncbi:uncharacterized protein LOC117322310 [Pecten maximus]|uniref:uncharacterized protein LOC117322310 n=1 Tax=Pecten maximus TaxID=6579 RepID=UPI0014583E42|nr:uncharacterized protein LOC117322310 [Pecten maximus]